MNRKLQKYWRRKCWGTRADETIVGVTQDGYQLECSRVTDLEVRRYKKKENFAGLQREREGI